MNLAPETIPNLNQNRASGPADPEREAAIVAMVEGGMSYRAVGKEFGISGARVGQIMNRSRSYWPDDDLLLPAVPTTTWPTGHPSVQEIDDFLASQKAARIAALPPWRRPPAEPSPVDPVP